MLTTTKPILRPPTDARRAIFVAAAMACCALGGCQDGPLYALKVANPYYSMREWKQDEEIGVTDHQRLQQLTLLSEKIGKFPPNRQAFWAGHLEQMIANDESPEMRRLAVRAAGQLKDDSSAMSMIEKGLDDDSIKVRMEACHALGRRPGDQAARTLAATVGTETEEDVRQAALSALANHKSQIAIDTLKTALADRNPATRDLAVQSLKGATGKDFGDDPKVWIAALEGKPAKEVPTRFAERLRGMF